MQPHNNTGDVDIAVVPDDTTALILIKHFFSTTLCVLPYVLEQSILEEYKLHQKQRFSRLTRVHRALYNIIWAHASSSLHRADAEIFYRRAVTLLDSLTIRETSPEMGR
jgi:hypothetical protein